MTEPLPPTAVAVLDANKQLAHFQQATENELRAALDAINDEMLDLQEKMKRLRKERQILEMLLYVMYPTAAADDGFQSAALMVASRLSQIRGDRGAGKVREVCSVEGCKLDVWAKGLCKDHYSQEERDKRVGPLKQGHELQQTAKRGKPRQKPEPSLAEQEILDVLTGEDEQEDDTDSWAVADEGKISNCCNKATYQGAKHTEGDRYCTSCNRPTAWRRPKNAP